MNALLKSKARHKSASGAVTAHLTVSNALLKSKARHRSASGAFPLWTNS
ncbi:MAG: hypothetical protein LBT01_00840 [Spirochaetaceae bacterium]|nr:hypothetical protein [Spirochaetaceae bacterium]